jgi:hypothetical protein
LVSISFIFVLWCSCWDRLAASAWIWIDRSWAKIGRHCPDRVPTGPSPGTRPPRPRSPSSPLDDARLILARPSLWESVGAASSSPVARDRQGSVFDPPSPRLSPGRSARPSLLRSRRVPPSPAAQNWSGPTGIDRRRS